MERSMSQRNFESEHVSNGAWHFADAHMGTSGGIDASSPSEAVSPASEDGMKVGAGSSTPNPSDSRLEHAGMTTDASVRASAGPRMR